MGGGEGREGGKVVNIYIIDRRGVAVGMNYLIICLLFLFPECPAVESINGIISDGIQGKSCVLCLVQQLVVIHPRVPIVLCIFN